MPDYNASYDPPAPVVEVTLHGASTGQHVSGVQMLMDTGADLTLVPRASITQLGISEQESLQYELAGFDGHISSFPAVDLDMQVFGHIFRGRYLVIDADEGILGRDVLNEVAVLFDEPQQQWAQMR
jgi:hypothetical protein